MLTKHAKHIKLQKRVEKNRKSTSIIKEKQKCRKAKTRNMSKKKEKVEHLKMLRKKLKV